MAKDVGLTEDEIRRLRRILRALPNEETADQAAELIETYRALGRVGKLALAGLKILAVVSAGVVAWLHLRGLWVGKGQS